MASELQNLDTLFNSKLFRIPDYQRGYAWERRQWDDFWQDLNRLGDGRHHYTGQLTIERAEDSQWQRWEDERWLIEGKAYRPFYVVDGQQRLTTVVILLKCLLDTIPEGGQLAFTSKEDHWKKYLLQTAGAVSRAFLFGYEKDNPSNEYLKTQILGESSNECRGTETIYTANLAGARDFFSEKLRNTPPDTVERLFKALSQRFVFSVYELEDNLDEFVVFETMNNRGKPLSKLELLKNRLIYLSTLFPVSTVGADLTMLRKNINEAWKTVYEYLGKVRGAPLNDDEFLRAHWIMYFNYAKPDLFGYYLLDRTFTPDRIFNGELTVIAIQQFVDSIQESVRKWHSINFPASATELPDNVRRGLERLDRIGRGAFGPLAMAALQKSRTESQTVEFLDAAEQFVFMVGRLCQRRADTGAAEFYRLAHQVFCGEKPLAEAIKTVRHDYTDYYFSLDKATTAMRDLFRLSDGFYSWSGRHYFLFEYEQHLRLLAGMATSKLDWHDFNAPKKDQITTIEHVFPQSATLEEWPSFHAQSEGEMKTLLHSLGNLLALSQSRNSRFSNRSFARKKRDEGGVQGYYNGSHSEIQVAQYDDWTPTSVLNRGIEMLEFMEKRWKKPLGTREDKIKLLNLDSLVFAPEAEGSRVAKSEDA